MNSPKVYLRSLLASWSGYGANVIVMFFLSPMVFQGLGKSQYGVWSLLMTISGYLGLAEIGVRVSTGRFVNYYLGKKDTNTVFKVVNTSLVFYTFAGILVFTGAMLIASMFGRLFPNTPEELLGQVKFVMVFMSINVWFGFVASVFGQLLECRNRFDLRTIVVLVTLFVRAAGTIIVLKTTLKLTDLAIVQVLSSVFGFMTIIVLNKFWGLKVKLAYKFVSKKIFREVFGYGAWAFIQNMSLRIISYTDIVLIALLIDMDNVAVYSIAAMLLHYVAEFAGHIFRVISPDLGKIAGRSDMSSLRKYVLNSTRVTLVIVVPIYTILIVWGGDFLNLWMGKGLEAAGKVLLLLGLSHLAGMMRWALTLGIKTIGHVKTTAIITMAEALGNLVLSIFFVVVMGWGVYGIAAGVLVPSILIGFVATVYYARNIIGVTIRDTKNLIIIPSLAAGIIFAVVCELIRLFIGLDSWAGFISAGSVAVVLYLPIAFYVLLNANHREYLIKNIALMLSKKQEAR